MTTYHQEKVQTAIAKALECLARDPKRAERLLGDVKKWSAEAEREAYARGKAAGLEEAAQVAQRIINRGGEFSMATIDAAIRALIPEN